MCIKIYYLNTLGITVYRPVYFSTRLLVMMNKTQQANAISSSSKKHTSTPGCFSGLKKFLASLARVFKGKRRNKGRKEEMAKGEQQDVEVLPSEECLRDYNPKTLPLDEDHSSQTELPQNSPQDLLIVPAPSQNTPANPFPNPEDHTPTFASTQTFPAPPVDSCVEVITPSTEDTSEWHLVCNKKSQGRKKKSFLETQKPKAVEASTSLTGTKCAKTNRRRKTIVPHQDSRDKVRQSWAQETVTVVLQVAPNMRGHVVGHGGEVLRTLAREYPGVRVMVPPRRDIQTTTVTIRGLPAQVTAVHGCISARLKAGQRKQHLPRGGPSLVTAATLAC